MVASEPWGKTGLGDDVYIVLFRGVGGATKLPVKELQPALTEAGFRHVRTYIASGNVVLASDLKAAAVRDRVAEVVKKKLGFTKAILVLTRKEWAAVVKQNPFPQALRIPRTLHAFILETKPPASIVKALQEQASAGSEKVVVRGKMLYLYTPDGFGVSQMGPAVEKALKARTTARNWNTVTKLHEIADEIAAELRNRTMGASEK